MPIAPVLFGLAVAAAGAVIGYSLARMLRRWVPEWRRWVTVALAAAPLPLLFAVLFVHFDREYHQTMPRRFDPIMSEGRAMGYAITELGCIACGLIGLLAGAGGALWAGRSSAQ